MVFSSSATVYGQPEKIPCVEDFKLQAMNPYGRTKVTITLFVVSFSIFFCWLGICSFWFNSFISITVLATLYEV